MKSLQDFRSGQNSVSRWNIHHPPVSPSPLRHSTEYKSLTPSPTQNSYLLNNSQPSKINSLLTLNDSPSNIKQSISQNLKRKIDEPDILNQNLKRRNITPWKNSNQHKTISKKTSIKYKMTGTYQHTKWREMQNLLLATFDPKKSPPKKMVDLIKPPPCKFSLVEM